MKISGKTFLVTGAASGLGEATTRSLIEQGANVVLADINKAGVELAAELGQAASFIATDITSEEDVQNAVNLAVESYGALHGVVHCAGIVVVQKLLDRELNPASLELFAKGVNINLVGTFNVNRLAAQAMAKNEPLADNERGIIINTASIAAFDGQVGQASYASSKAGVAGMALPLARELSRHGIRVMTLAPGVFETPMMSDIPDEAVEALGNSVPFPKRLGKPAEFAAMACHIIENTMLNGEVIRLDGAIRMV
ncbi:3-hydroxyacyl-CoA dehydrogenase [Oceanospirillum linum]|uniref:3-hydroxyacyl-CoA dehydrogenase n=1 Tax=Oceanospirillum linum TaxID=966 RepID=A0A1T1HFI6_OCELI|nr:3-hydroxyacyl-CoA dehydrogenase [Oceanospirillum linum]OOV88611.1 3-hydroxyacyl-CoA dehydrogenase [Oceanospirillum linum]SEG05573.1 NAD(P)-dependent dehydrogenase, short-chain alcohol dehydrogenase family [Oleiphilus messinensis]SMP20736.1 NAD(P)-dependent dehydrogenase, short-chain alcohol dehydrogenase family [Oceanospirillum linum]